MADKQRDSKILLAIPKREINESFFNKELYTRLDSLGIVDRYEGLEPMSEDELAEAIKGNEIVVTGWGQAPFTEKVMENADALRLIAHCGGSVANYVGPEVYGRGVRVVTGNDAFARSVSEACLGLMIASLRRFPYYDQEMKQGRWRGPLDTEGLFNKRVGLIGYGAIPRFLVPMLSVFDCDVSAYDPYVSKEIMASHSVKKAELESILESSDIVSVHLPRNPSTDNLLTESYLRMMKPGALLVNTARASVLDETALAKMLHEGLIFAAVDVYQTEPLPIDSPLRAAPNTILIPHMGGPTLDQRITTTKWVIDDIERYINGDPLKHEVSEFKASLMTR